MINYATIGSKWSTERRPFIADLQYLNTYHSDNNNCRNVLLIDRPNILLKNCQKYS